MSRFKLATVASAIAALAAFATTPAAAATSTNGFATALDKAPWGATFQLDKFDPALGTLQGVTFDIKTSSFVDFTAKYQNTNGQSPTILFNQLGGQMQYTFPGNIVVQAPGSASSFLETFNGGGNGVYITETRQTQTYSTEGLVVISPVNFSLFTGPGKFDMQLIANPNVVVGSLNGDISLLSANAHVGGSAKVSYIYAPVPEPETYALMLAGLAGVGLVARRRQAKA